MLEYVIIGLLVAILLELILLGISLKKRKEAAEIDSTKLSEDISAKIKEDISKAVRETVSEVSERVGGVSNTLESVVELFEKTRKELPRDVKEPVNEVLERALKDLKEFNKNIAEMGNELPNKVLKSIQSGISVRKGKVGELTTLMRLLADYKRIIPLGQPVDFIGISDEYVDFIEVKTGAAAGLTQEERDIKGLIGRGKVRFILKREEAEITTPEGTEELTGEFVEGDADVIEKTRKVREGEAKGEICVCLNCGEPLNGEFDACPYCGEPLLKQSGRGGSTGASYEENEELKTEKYVRDFVSAAEIYEKTKTKTYDSELFEKLRRLRANMAREKNVAPFAVFHNSVLKEIATVIPTTKEELLLIKGIGIKKVEKYGEKLLNVIRAHLSEKSRAQI